MELSPELLIQALTTLYVPQVSPNPELFHQSEQYIINAKDQPDGILLFLNIILNYEPSTIRKAAIANLITIVNKKWRLIPPEIRSQSQLLIIQIIQKENMTYEELGMMAEICADVFKYLSFWNDLLQVICARYLNGNYQFTTLFLSRIFQNMPLQVLNAYQQSFQNMAMSGLQTDNVETCLNAIKIFVIIGEQTRDFNSCFPAIDYLLNNLIHTPQYDNSTFSMFWQPVHDILSIENIPPEIVASFYGIASEIIANEQIYVENRRIVLSEFEPVISKVSSEILIDMISKSFMLAAIFISFEQNIPEDYFSLIDEALAKRSNDVFDFIKEKAYEFIGQAHGDGVNIPPLILALTIIRSMITNVSDMMQDEVDFITRSLQLAFSVNVDVVLCSALRLIDQFDELFESASISSIAVSLMRQIAPLIVSPSKMIHTDASNAVQTLCDLCDTEIEGIFALVWSFNLHQAVPPNYYDQYLLVLARVILISKDVDSSALDDVLQFVVGIMSKPSDGPSVEKAVSLTVLISIFEKRHSLLDSILPMVDPLLREFLRNGENDEIVIQALSFIRNLAFYYRNRVSEFVLGFFQELVAIISNHSDIRRSYLKALGTMATAVKFCGCIQFLRPLLDEIVIVLRCADSDALVECCGFLATISRAMPTVDFEFVKPIFEFIVNTVIKSDEVDVVNACCEAISKLYKRCRNTNCDFYDQKIADLIRKIISGNIACLGGNPENIFQMRSEMVSYLLELFDVFLRTSPPNANEFFGFLLNWLPKANEEVVGSIIGTLTESVKRIEVPSEIIANVVGFLSGEVQNITEIRLVQNVAYFLSVLLTKFPQQASTVVQFFPFFQKWWEEGSEKEIGFQSCLSNIAVLYLRLYILGAEVPLVAVNNAIAVFPPADKSETQNMAELILQIFFTLQKFPQLLQGVILNIAVAFAHILTAQPSSINLSKLDQQTFIQIQQNFAAIVQHNEPIKNHLIQMFQGNIEKQEMLAHYF